MMAVESRMVALGQVIPDFTLKSVQGDLISLDDFVEAPALMVAFLCNHCPYVRHVEKKLGSVLAGLPDLAVLGVCSNDVEAYPDDAPPNLLEQARRAGWNFPYLVDEDQDVARAFGAACTPDFFLYDADRLLAYRGAFDESTPGNRKPVTGELLADAALRVLADEPVPEPHRASMGCSIKWKPGLDPTR
jgi:peroxiredoxin